MDESLIGDIIADGVAEQTERRISAIYSAAAKDIKKAAEEFQKSFEKNDKEMLKMLQDEKITKQEYIDWRMNHIARSEQFNAMNKAISERMTSANEMAMEVINGNRNAIYAIGVNTEMYSIFKECEAAGIKFPAVFTIFDDKTVGNLAKNNPVLMPYYPPERAVARGIDLEYGQKVITNEVARNITAGKSLRETVDSLCEKITTMDRKSAMRAARTATGAALNSGRQRAIEDLSESTGWKIKKEWISIADNRTRDSHIMLNGVQVDSDDEFPNGLQYPRDPNGEPCEVYNCRCTMRSIMPVSQKYNPPKRSVEEYNDWKESAKTMSKDDEAAWREAERSRNKEEKMKVAEQIRNKYIDPKTGYAIVAIGMH